MTSFAKPLAYSVLTLCVICATVSAQAQRQQNYIGDGGKVISLTIFVPQSTGLAKDQSYIPALVQGEFVSNFSNFSAISILDWERLDDIYVKLVNEAYDDKAEAKQDVVLGRLAPTSHFLTGNIIKTETGYNIKMNVTKTADKMTVATYTGTFTFAELDNLTGIRRASLELLQNVGVTLTEKARQELVGAAAANQISAQTALAKGVTAQRAGTEVAALSYFYQAASFNPALKEAVKRSSVMAANIKSGNIGSDVRNDILWRKNWVAKLKETEEAFYEMINAADPPYTLIYFTDIKTGDVNYQTETADLSIAIDFRANLAWFTAMERALGAAQAVLDGLNATNRKKDWGLEKWPWGNNVLDDDPFKTWTYDITVVFELANQQGQVISSQTVKLNQSFEIPYNNKGLITVKLTENNVRTVNFDGIRADDISDKLTIRVASVNGELPQQARFAITAIPLVEKTQPLTDTRNGKKYNTVKIGGKTWMAENLNYQPKAGDAQCYDYNNTNCNKYGKLYNWNTAMTACPAGWHLSTREEWNNLIALVGREKAGKRLKSKNGWDNNDGTDDYGFSALPGGFRFSDYSGYGYVGKWGFWWAATGGSGYGEESYKRIENGRDYVSNGFLGPGSLASAASVRCIQD